MSTTWKLTSLIVLGRATFVAAADDGDDFSNNLFSDLAPLLALFGERATMQFMSQSMGWADNIILAMAPLGIVTALVSAIRVGGPQWLKAIIGRARENLAAAEVELMSSTSEEVCELWNGQQVVRCLGKSPIAEFICLLQTAENTKNMASQENHLVEIGPPVFSINPCKWVDKNTAENDVERHPEQVQRESSSQSNPLSHRIVFLRNEANPNISLNSHSQFTRWELYLVALVGIVLQLGVVIYSGVATYYLKLKKGGAPIETYAFPLDMVGTLLLVTGMLLCGHVVESSTEEKRYKAKVDGTKTRIFWLQKPQTVNDQVFPSFAIWARDRKYITKSKRIRDGRLDNSAVSVSESGSDGYQDVSSDFKSFSIDLHENATVTIQASQARHRRKNNEKSTNGTRTKTSPKSPEGWMTRRMPVFSAAITFCAFILQFIGLRGLHWSSSVCQLGAVLIMTGLRAWVRRGLVEKLESEPLDQEFQLEWFALSLRRPDKLFQLRTSDSAEEAFKDWRVVTGNSPVDYQGLEEIKTKERPQIYMEDRMLDAYGVMKIRRQLGVLADWRGPASAEAISLAKAIETTMDALFTLSSYSKFSWSLKVSHGSELQTIYFEIKREGAKWRVDSTEIDAALSLWLYSTNEQDKQMHAKPEDEVPVQQSNEEDSQFRGNELSAKQNLQLLGPCTESLHQDLQWWLPTDAARVIQVIETEKDTGGVIMVEPHRVVGCGVKQEDKAQRRDGPRFFNVLKNDEATSDSQASLLAMESIGRLQLLYSQDMFSAFMRAVAKTLKSPIHGGVIIQPIGIDSDQNDWKSFTLRNDTLHKMVQDICNTGLGNLGQIYLAIIPSLSAERKLPETDKIVDLAREKAKPYELVADWESAAEVYRWLLKMVTKSSEDTHTARRATAMLMEYLDRVNRNVDLRKSQKYREEDIESLESVKSKLEESLETVNQTTKESLESYKQQVGEKPEAIATIFNTTPKKDIYDRTALHYHILLAPERYWTFHVDRFSQSDLNAQDLQGRTPLHYACIGGKDELVINLLRRGAKGDVQCMDGRTPLHYAVTNCDFSVVKSFLEAGTSLDVRDSIRQTPLFLAAFTGKAEVVQYLWKDVNQRLRDDQGRIALHLASMAGHIDMVKWLIEEGKMDKEARNNDGWTALHVAARYGYEAIVRYLIEDAEVDKEARDSNDLRALHMAAQNGHEAIVRYLIEDAEVDKEARDRNRLRALHRAAQNGHEAIVRYLIEGAKVDKEARDHDGCTALHLAARSEYEAIVRYLIEDAKVDKEARDNCGRTTLQLAARYGHEAVVRYLIEDAKVDKEAMVNYSETVSSRFLCNPDDDLVWHLIANDKDKKEARNNDGETALHLAARYGHEAVVRYLIEDAKVDKEARNNRCLTALHVAARYGYEAIVRYLIGDAEVDKEARDNYGWTALHMAAQNGHEAIVRYLIEDAEVDKEARDSNGLRALHRAAQNGHEAIVRYLIEDAEVDKEAKDSNGLRALHMAAQNGHQSIVRYLIEGAKVDKEARDDDGCTALHLAALSEYEAIVRYLIEDAKVDKEAWDNDNWRALHWAAQNGHEAIVRYLIGDAEVDKEARDNDGWTALQLAARYGHEAVVRYLNEDAKVDKEAMVNYSETVSSRALCNPHDDLVWHLIGNDKDKKEARNNDGETALHLAAQNGHEAIVRYLIEDAEVDKEARDSNDLRALHMAAQNGHEAIVRYLIEGAKVDKEARDDDGCTALHLAARSEYEAIVRYLIEDAKVDKEARDNYGWTALHMAAQNGYEAIVRYLIEDAEVDKEARDSNGLRALHMAAQNGHQAIVRYLIEDANVDKNSQDGGKETALHKAVKSGHQTIVRYLLDEVIVDESILSSSNEMVSQVATSET